VTHSERLPHDDSQGRGGGLVRRLRRTRPGPEERLHELVEAHRRELEERTRRFEETLAELERRERLLADSRASVERMLRLGTRDLDAREEELARFLRELTEREERVREQEDELARRRSELGAVELKRLQLEQRERALAAREQRLEGAERQIEAKSGGDVGEAPAPVRLAFVPGRRYELAEIEPTAVAGGETLVVDGLTYTVARVGPSPLPGDRRRCAYLLPE
jgi:septal ring factor EnvC (AmiA/AmiB activator)